MIFFPISYPQIFDSNSLVVHWEKSQNVLSHRTLKTPIQNNYKFLIKITTFANSLADNGADFG